MPGGGIEPPLIPDSADTTSLSLGGYSLSYVRLLHPAGLSLAGARLSGLSARPSRGTGLVMGAGLSRLSSHLPQTREGNLTAFHDR